MDRHNYIPQMISFFSESVELAAAKGGADSGLIRIGSDCRWLRARNCSGDNIYVRPPADTESHYLLLDDLTAAQIESHIGQPGRLVVETSPGNHQIWIRYSQPISIPEKNYLIAAAGADRGATPAGRWGRCPGFSNRKPKHVHASNYYPSRLFFVRLVQQTDGYEQRPDFPATASLQSTLSLSSAPLLIASEAAPERACSIARAYYRSALQRTAHPDLSRVDLSLSVCLLSYSYSPADIAATIIECSPDFERRKKSPDYAMRTALTATQQRRD